MMNDCKHPKAYLNNLGTYYVCNICGARIPKNQIEQPKVEALQVEKIAEPKEEKIVQVAKKKAKKQINVK